VYKTVRKIPKGKVMTYKEVAEKAGFPFSWRAVGNALNKNRSSSVPCHRVIRSDGSSGGFNKGFLRKKFLLRKEGIKIWKNRL